MYHWWSSARTEAAWFCAGVCEEAADACLVCTGGAAVRPLWRVARLSGVAATEGAGPQVVRPAGMELGVEVGVGHGVRFSRVPYEAWMHVWALKPCPAAVASVPQRAYGGAFRCRVLEEVADVELAVKAGVADAVCVEEVEPSELCHVVKGGEDGDVGRWRRTVGWHLWVSPQTVSGVDLKRFWRERKCHGNDGGAVGG
jgi:hypothetical protein